MSIFKNNKYTQKLYRDGKRYHTVFMNNKIWFRDKTVEEMYPVGGRIYYVDKTVTGDTSSMMGTWLFKDTLTLNLTFRSDVEMEIDGNVFKSFNVYASSSSITVTYKGGSSSYEYIYDVGWVKPKYRTVKILAEPTDTSFINFMKSNATKLGAVYKFYDSNMEELPLLEQDKLDVTKLGTAKYWSASGLDTKSKYYVVATTKDGNPEGNIVVGSSLHFAPSNSYTVGATSYDDGKWNMDKALTTAAQDASNNIFRECRINYREAKYGGCNDWYIPAQNQDNRLKNSGVNDAAKIATTSHWSGTENGSWGRAWTSYPGSWTYYGMNKGGNYMRYYVTRQFGATTTFTDATTGKSYYQIEGLSTGTNRTSRPTQYIDTAYSIDANTKIDIVYKWNVIDANDQCLFGASNRYNTNMFGLCIQSETGDTLHQRVRWYGNSTATRYLAEAGTKYRFVATKKEIQWINMDEGTFEHASATDSYVGSLYLFAANTRTTWGHTSSSTIHSCKLWSGTTLMRDYVAVKCVEDGELGLFDRVNNKFYGNAGTGSFVEG